MTPETKAALRRFPWLRLLHRLTTLARAARHDPDLEADHIIERGRAAKLNRSVENIARNAVGCVAPNPCQCVRCIQDRS